VLAAQFWQPLDEVALSRTNPVSGSGFLALLPAAGGLAAFASAAYPFLLQILVNGL
jgi:hypothetical protein